jgi:hypothetical protein
MPRVFAWLLVVLCAAGTARGQSADAGAAAAVQTETDAYTGYELLSPESASFAIRYEVTATTAGAKYYFNPIRKGSVASGESVVDVMTGQPLRFEVVSGEEAIKDPLMKGEDASVDYIKVYLARPVPAEGQARLLILKTYKDAKSYFREGNTIIFSRPLGVPRNSVVLPGGYELVACNVGSQVLAEPDGRIAISFLNGTGAAAPLMVKAKPGAQTGAAAAPRAPGPAKSWEAPFEGEAEKARLSERAHQDREIVYFLEQPETHAFRLYHDYTESRAGADKYFNVVRTGSKVSDPSAYVLDTGEKLATKLMTGAELAAAKLDAREPVDPAAQVVVIPFSPVKAGQSLRLRISPALANLGDLYRPGELPPGGRRTGVRPEPGTSAQRRGAPGGMVPAGQLNSGEGHADGGRPHPAGFLERSAGCGGRSDQGEAAPHALGPRN